MYENSIQVGMHKIEKRNRKSFEIRMNMGRDSRQENGQSRKNQKRKPENGQERKKGKSPDRTQEKKQEKQLLLQAETQRIRQVIVVGGGAAGLLAAIAAAKNGAQVTILEHKEQLGKKILSTGNGRCNLGNRNMAPECYHCGQQAFPWEVFGQFGLEENIRFWEALGLVIKDKNGYLYPWSESAAAVAEILRQEVQRLKIEVITECHVRALKPVQGQNAAKKGIYMLSTKEAADKERVWMVCADRGEFFGERVILAAGSRAASVLGSDGSGYKMAEQLGYSLIPVLPALVQLRCQGTFFKAWSGVRTEAGVTLWIDEKQAAQDTGEVQLTDYGISGIPVFQVSRFAAVALHQGKQVEAVLDFLPFLHGEERKREWFAQRLLLFSEKTAEEFVYSILHRKLAAVLLRCAGMEQTQRMGQADTASLKKLYQVLCAFRLRVTETNSFEQAQVCCGGVDVRQVEAKTLESKLHKGLYFAGEILDVDGICGGYNLQWAFSSGSVAGKAAALSLKANK